MQPKGRGSGTLHLRLRAPYFYPTALNLTLSPENHVFWDCADPLIMGAGETEGALETSADRHPGVADSIEHDNDDGVTRRASEKAPKGPW